jgi:hypothetical protein
MMKLILILLVFSPSLFAAVKNQSFNDKVLQILEKPHQEAVNQVKYQSPSSISMLKEIAFDEKQSMNIRWKSFMVLTEVEGLKSLNEIKKALTNSTWFMRSAGLTALSTLDKQGAKKWAYQKLHRDPALLVRMKALEILQSDMDESIVELFWNKLNAKDSFHLNKALWIREDIAQVLLKSPRQKDLSKWVKLLYDKEKKFQIIASAALSRLHPNQNNSSQDLSFWQKKYPQSVKL